MKYTYDYSEFFLYFFVFTRLSGVLMMLPGIGEVFIPLRIRLTAAIVLSFVITPLVAHTIPVTKLVGFETLYYFIRETLIGLTLGIIGRIMLNALQVTANIVAYQTSLSSAVMFNPAVGGQDSTFSTYLIMGATTLIFITNMHYQIIEVFINSYDAFPPNGSFPFGGFKELIIKIVNHSFNFGIRLALPFLIAGIVINVATGLLSRLVPQMQVYFLMMPAQILLGIAFLGITVVAILNYFLQEFFQLYQDLPRGV